MDELKRGLEISLHGAAARQALTAFQQQAKAWGVALPPVQPLVLDFGLGVYEKTGLIEYWIANEACAGYCGKYLFVCGGQTCPEHRHRIKHETFFVVKGRVQMRCGGRTRVMKEGDVLPVPPGRKHSFTGIGPALLLELSMPCKVTDNYFSNRQIPIGGNAAPCSCARAKEVRE
jgi:mannose-6-phosphate isomerase-like protein (cupin superfamily)